MGATLQHRVRAGGRLGGERDDRRLEPGQEHRPGRAQVGDERLFLLLAGNERRPAGQLVGPVQVAAGDAPQAGLRDPTEQLPPVDELDAIDEPAQLAPAPPPLRVKARRRSKSCARGARRAGGARLRAFTATVPAGCGPVGERAVKIRRRTGRRPSRSERRPGWPSRSATGTSRQIVRSPEAAKPGPRAGSIWGLRSFGEVSSATPLRPSSRGTARPR